MRNSITNRLARRVESVYGLIVSNNSRNVISTRPMLERTVRGSNGNGEDNETKERVAVKKQV